MGRFFAGQWHWDDARPNLDACIAHLDAQEQALSPRSSKRRALAVLRRQLEHADKARHDSMCVWRWGVALAHHHGLEDPSAYAHALTDSMAIRRPSFYLARAAGGLPDDSTPEESERLADFQIKARASAGLPFQIDDEVAHG